MLAVLKWLVGVGVVLAGLTVMIAAAFRGPSNSVPQGRAEVVFWHFWGGADRAVVDDVVRRFNESQEAYWVRAIAVPGNNLDAKLFLTIAGGDPPDLVNQDDPVVADWYGRGAIQAVADFAGDDAEAELDAFLLPAAKRLADVDGKLVAVPNGLDIRMLYYNRSLLDRRGWTAPTTLAEFDQITNAISPATESIADRKSIAYLPDPRRLWAWGYVFGGQFFDSQTGQVQLDTPQIIAALQWMTNKSREDGADAIARFRRADQSLPGKVFPILPIDDDSDVGRYVFVMDGQWRVRDIENFEKARRQKGLSPIEFDACPLPYPATTAFPGRRNSGWVNGNFFLVPRGAGIRGVLGNSCGFGSVWPTGNRPRELASLVAGFRYRLKSSRTKCSKAI